MTKIINTLTLASIMLLIMWHLTSCAPSKTGCASTYNTHTGVKMVGY